MSIAKRWGCLLLAMLLTISLVSCTTAPQTDWNDPIQGSSSHLTTSTTTSAPDITTEDTADNTTASVTEESGSSTTLESTSDTETEDTTSTTKKSKTSKTKKSTTVKSTVSETETSTTESSQSSGTTAESTALTTPTTSETTTVTTTKKTTTTTTKPPKEQRNILIIGNSHSIDAVWLLHQAYLDQYPNTDLCVGILYYSGGSVREHAEVTKTGAKFMSYYKNTNGTWKITKGHGTKDVLQDREWDTILFQPGKEDLKSGDMNLEYRRQLEAFVDKHVKNPHQFVWHVSWPNPNDELFYSPDYVRQPPSRYRENLEKLYGFNPVTQFEVMQGETRNNILSDTTYAHKVCTGTAIMHAHLTQGVSQVELWRDYTHVNDYGRLIVAYAMVAQLTKTPIEKVGVSTIPAKMRHEMYSWKGDLKITKEMKSVLIKAANYSLQYPWSMPPQN